MTRACIYVRCSTLLNQDVNNQIIPLREFCRHRGFEIAFEFRDEGVSGVKDRRPGLDQMMREAKAGRFDVLVVTALDRVSRSTKHLLGLVDDLNHAKVKLVSLREQFDMTSPQGTLLLTILSAVGAIERDLCRERVKSSLAAKKLLAERTGSGWRCGRPPVINDEIRRRVIELRRSGTSIRGIEKALEKKISRGSVERILSSARSKESVS